MIVFTFFVAIAYRKNDKPIYYRYIFTFIILGLLLSANSIINNFDIWIFNENIPLLIQQSLQLIQYLMLGLFFKEVLAKSSYINKIILLFYLSITIYVTLMIIMFVSEIEIKPIISSSLFLLIFYFFYVKDLMNNKPFLILVKSSSFWITIGIFFYSCISFPVSSLIPFIPKNHEYINLRGQIFSITNMSLIVLYLFILKSYLCLKHPQNL